MSDLTPVRVPKSFKSRLAKKTPKMQAAIAATVLQLRSDWRHPGLRTHKMQGVGDIYEAYVDHRNRVTFFWEGDRIVLENHCPHSVVSK